MLIVSRKLRPVLLASAALSWLGPNSAWAQEAVDPAVAPPPVATPVAGKKVFTGADFARFAPRNALDMLRQIPGFSIREADEERGLGQASENVLLNGQRVQSKSGGAIAEMQKIPADNVDRIEIVEAATLGIAGLSGEVANVIARSSKASGQFSWRPEFRAHYTDPIFTRGDVSYSGESGPVGFTVGLDSAGSRSGAGGPTTLFGADGLPFEFRDDAWRANYDNPKLSGRFTLDGPGSSVGNLNLSAMPYWYDFKESSYRDRPREVDRTRDTSQTITGFTYEVGGDFAFALGPGRIKLIGLRKYEDEPLISTALFAFADGSAAVGDRFERDGKSGEWIARAEYGWKTGPSEWQLSGEAAFNTLDSVTRLFELGADGEFAAIDFPGGTGRVREDRFELLATYGRPLGSAITLQFVAGVEYSKLGSESDVAGLERSFFRPKGSLSLAWKASDATDVSVTFRRRVGQLDFYDFLASVNLTDDRQNAGNLSLVPPQSWEVDVEASRKLGAWGTSRVRLFGRLIDDIVDIIPIGDDGQSPGNIDRAVRYGIEWKSTFLLDPLGWRGAKLDATMIFQRSRLDDPLTGESRPISGDLERELNAGLRHDIPGGPWAWGASLYSNHSSRSYRLTEVGRVWEGPFWLGLFVEHKALFGLTARATINNLLNARSRWERTVFDGRRTGPVLFRESRDRLIGPIFSLSLRGNF